MSMRFDFNSTAAAASQAPQPNPSIKPNHAPAAAKAPPGPVEQVASAFGALLANSPLGKLL